MEDIRKVFKTETGKEIDINTRVFAHSVTHINPEYVLWLEKKLNNSIILPDEQTIKERIDEQENYHLEGMKKEHKNKVTIEFAAMCCANSFDDAIRWLKDRNKK